MPQQGWRFTSHSAHIADKKLSDFCAFGDSLFSPTKLHAQARFEPHKTTHKCIQSAQPQSNNEED